MPLLVGTLLISTVAMVIAVPVGLMSAIYLSETRPGVSAPPAGTGNSRRCSHRGLWLFAALTVAPFIPRSGRDPGPARGIGKRTAAGLVMGIMIIPL